MDSDRLEKELFVEGFALASADLAEEVAFKAFLSEAHPAAFRRPLDIARRNLRLSDECNAPIAKVCEADSIPRGFRGRRLAPDQRADVLRRRGHHGFDHEAGFGHADGDCRLAG